MEFFLAMYLTFLRPGNIIEYVDVPVRINAAQFSQAAKYCDSDIANVRDELLALGERRFLSGTCRRISQEEYDALSFEAEKAQKK